MKSNADYLLDIIEGYIYSRNCQKYYRLILPSLIDFFPQKIFMLFPNANSYSYCDIIINDKWFKSQHSQ